jgi:4-amino-4-deoxychorismate lyase
MRNEASKSENRQPVPVCLETIRIQHGQLHNLPYHQARFDRTRRDLFDSTDVINLQNKIQIPADLQEGIFKCRVIYDIDIQTVEFAPYIIKPLASLQLVTADDLHYAYKYLDRSALLQLLDNCPADDILIVKNGLLTDTSYANVVFWDGDQWFTPDPPLLPGTKRQQLLDNNQIIAKKLRPRDLQHFTHARLINAMLDLDSGSAISTQQIYPLF